MRALLGLIVLMATPAWAQQRCEAELVSYAQSVEEARYDRFRMGTSIAVKIYAGELLGEARTAVRLATHSSYRAAARDGLRYAKRFYHLARERAEHANAVAKRSEALALYNQARLDNCQGAQQDLQPLVATFYSHLVESADESAERRRAEKRMPWDHVARSDD